MVTDQDIFIKIKTHLLEQGERSLAYDGSCVYRGTAFNSLREVWENNFTEPFPKNRVGLFGKASYLDQIKNILPLDVKCAIGVIISDEHYSPTLEGCQVDNNSVLEAIARSNPDWEMDYNWKNMLLELQAVHDQDMPNDWGKHFDRFEFDSDGSFVCVKDEVDDFEGY